MAFHYVCATNSLSLKIALIGYGKMGRAIENAALSRDHSIVVTINQDSTEEDYARIADADVAIEFTTPDTAPEHIAYCFDRNIPIVVGTTGWYDHYPEIKRICLEQNQSLLTATNFSLGVNIFFEINKRLAELMGQMESYDVQIEEIHHTEKLDAPSGTAISLATQMVERLKWKKTWKLVEEQEEEELSPSTLGVHAKRIEDVSGTHSVKYTSAIDDIEIIHTAHSRAGFAYGAVLAAEWLAGKKGVFGMENVIKNQISL